MGVIAEESVLIKAETGTFMTQMTAMGGAANIAGGGISKLGLLAGGAAAGGVALLGKSLIDGVNKAGDFEQKLNILSASTDHAGHSMKEVSDLAIKLGADVGLPGVSASDAADAMLQLGKSGFDLGESMKAARGTLLLATAAETDAGNAAKVVTQNLNAFHLTAKDTNTIVDQMAGFMNQTGTDFAAFTDSLSYVAAPAHAAGQSFKDTAAQLAILSQNGIEGSMAGTGLRQIISRLAAASPLLTANFADIGVSLKNSKGEFVGMHSIIEQMEPALSKMSRAQQITFFKTNFGMTAMNQANIVLGAGKEKYEQITAAIEKKGQADKLAAAHMQGFKGAMAQLGSSLESLQIEIGLKLLPVLTRFVNWLAQELPVAVAFVTRVIDGLSKVYEQHRAQVEAVMTTLRAIIGQTVAFIIDHWNSISAVLEFVVNNIADRLRAIFTIISGVVNLIGDLIHGRWDQIWGDVVQIVTGYLEYLDALWLGIPGMVLNAFAQIPGIITNALSALPGLFIDAVGALAGAAGELATGAVNALIGGLGDLAGTVAEWIAGGVGAISGAAADAVTAAAGWASGLIGAVTGGLGDLGSTIGTWIGEGVTAISGAVANAVTAAAGFATSIVTAVTGGLEGIGGGITTGLGGVTTAIATFATNVLANAAHIGERIIAGVVQGLQGIATEAIKVIDNITGAVAKYATDIYTGASRIGERIILGVRAGLDGIGGKALEIIDNISDTIAQYAQDVWEKAGRIGERIIKGAVAGLDGIGKAMGDVIRAAVNGAIDLLNRGFNLISDHWPDFPGGPGNPIGHNPVPHLAKGGIAMSPTLALIGEAGPEAVVPLNQLFSAGRTTGYEQPVELDDHGLVEKIGELIDEIRSQRDSTGVTILATGGANAAVMAARR